MKRIWKLLCFGILCLIFSQMVCAEELISEKEPLNIIFVIDGSGSMKTNDPSKIGLDMVQAFIDTVQTEDIRIGYVAYSDEIISYASPESIETVEQREKLKMEIGSITYSGDTDIGMGVTYAYELLAALKDGRQMMVLISDGETDLPMSSSRTAEQSNQELAFCVSQCKEENIQIYTVAFGQYGGNAAFLQGISKETGAESYSVQSPENLIEVLYGISQDNLLFQIQKFSSGTYYAGGSQNITCVLDSAYVDEISILLLSTGSVGQTAVQYGESEFGLTDLKHYAVGKIESGALDPSAKGLVINTMTEERQDLQIYVISYRKLTPVLNIASNAARNQELEYQIYFKDRNGDVITDAGFYEAFSCRLSCVDSDENRDNVKIGEAEVRDGVLKGTLRFTHSGTYSLSGTVSDNFGSYALYAQIEVTNSAPSGSIPEKNSTLLEGERMLCLDDYFMDEDGDELFYSIANMQTEGIRAQLDGSLLTIVPQSNGTHMVVIQISDGEETIQYLYRLAVIPLWQAYWWVIALILLILVFIVWKLTYKPKPELERLIEEKKKYHFCGKLDAYFVMLPEDEEDIPPLSFQINRVKDGRVSLGTLLEAYPQQVEALQLYDIYLIADEKRNMILFHTSNAGVMVGNCIVCKQIQYSISFGDVIYINSPDGCYDLEIHYVAVFQ